jgi:hypothetical protein
VTSTLPDNAGRTEETYLGYGRASRFSSPEAGSTDKMTVFSLPANLPPDHWALSGPWIQQEQNIEAAGDAVLELSFRAKKVYLVLGPADRGVPGPITVTINGKNAETPDIKNGVLVLKEYRLYTLYDGDKSINGRLRLKTGGGLKAYAFTFG